MSRSEPKPPRLRCDALGCGESHPIAHECYGEPCFGPGRWLGWVYLDLNRPDLFPRELRFCSVTCCQWWLERECVTNRPRSHHHPGVEVTPLDEALRRPLDELALLRAGFGVAL